jgi:hypothetical protein
MNIATSPQSATLDRARDVFPPQSRADFAECYPEEPHILRHTLSDHPLLELGALAELAEQLPIPSVEYNRGNVPIGVDGKPGGTGLSIGDTIRAIHDANSWAVLKNIEQVPTYRSLLLELLGELQGEIEKKTGAMLRPQGFIFISSPQAVTPYHFDPEHNILLQLTGSKVMTQFAAGDPRFASDKAHEAYHTGGARELKWDESYLECGCEFPLDPGDALFVPVMAPHFVKNGPESSISLSITWRSDWSFAESDARAFNAALRKMGMTPTAPKRWPAANSAKAIAYRAMRKLGLAGQV